jgi:hydroxylamine reductase (hybrid-cluster protein)
VLRNRAYIAINDNGNKASWKPIVKEDLFNRVQELLGINRKSYGNSYNRREGAKIYLISGIAYHHCGGKVHGSGGKRNYHYYRCAQCRTQINAEMIEEEIISKIDEYMQRDDKFQHLKKAGEVERERLLKEYDDKIAANKRIINETEKQIKGITIALANAKNEETRNRLQPELEDIIISNQWSKRALEAWENERVNLELDLDDYIKYIVSNAEIVTSKNLKAEELKEYIINSIEKIIIYKDRIDVTFKTKNDTPSSGGNGGNGGGIMCSESLTPLGDLRALLNRRSGCAYY